MVCLKHDKQRLLWDVLLFIVAYLFIQVLRVFVSYLCRTNEIFSILDMHTSSLHDISRILHGFSDGS